MKKLFITSILSVLLFSCTPSHHNKDLSEKHHHKQKVQCYKTKTDNGDWLFWYILLSNNGGANYNYYYSSPVAVTSFSDASFTKFETVPFNYQEAESQGSWDVEQEDFSQDMQNEFNENAEYFGGQDETENGDYEGATNSSADESEEGSSEGSSSDGGGSDGGGDSGGGDGGGGE